jgi:hypothetical protein
MVRISNHNSKKKFSQLESGPTQITSLRQHNSLSGPVQQAVYCGDEPDPADEELVGLARDRVRWLHLNQFYALLWAADTVDLSVYGIWAARAGLEGEEDRLVPEALSVEAACAWFILAGHFMHPSREIYGPRGNPEWYEWSAPGRGGPLWDGVDRYHPDRWDIWKRQLNTFAMRSTERPHAIEAAKVLRIAYLWISGAG